MALRAALAVCLLAMVLPPALAQLGTTNVTSANGLGLTPVIGQYVDNPGCNAQSGGCIWPTDLAEFSSGALFDIRVEVHSAMNGSTAHSVTIQKGPTGTPQSLDAFFGVTNTSSAPYIYTYVSDYSGATVKNNSVGEYWRNVTLTDPGVYVVQLTTGSGQVTKVSWTIRPITPRSATNVILFIADGMTVPMITAARLVSRGQSAGKFRRPMFMDTMPYVGLAHTSGVDAIITDSANSATAYNTGHKSSVNALNVYADTTSNNLGHAKIETLAEQAKRRRGMAVGVVSTAEIQDATPAAVFAHTRRRDDKNFITDQMFFGTNVSNGAFSVSSGQGLSMEVILGGGGAYFHAPKSLDSKDYYGVAAGQGYNVALNKTAMYAAAAAGSSKLLGIFHESNMDKWLDRNIYPQNIAAGKDFPDGSGRAATDQPGLVDMVNVSLSILSKNPNGFYLMVEAASVDKMAHALDWERMLGELIEFDEAVGYALAWNAKRGNDTLIIATADHGHGYDVWGTVDTQAFNAAVTANATDAEKRKAIGVYQTAGYPGYTVQDVNNFPDTWAPRYTLAQGVADFPPFNENFQVKTSGVRTPAVPAGGSNFSTFNASRPQTYYVANPKDSVGGLSQNGNLDPAQSQGVHTLTDVPVFAQGPGSIALAKVQDNTRVFFAMHDALGLSSSDSTVTPDTMSTMCAQVRGF